MPTYSPQERKTDAAPRSSSPSSSIDSSSRRPAELREMSFGAAEARLAPVQARGDGSTELTRGAAAEGVRGGGQAPPHLEAVQTSFGHHDLGGVRAHVGGPAAKASEAMGAQAYATGQDVGFKSAPDLFTAAHEYAHTVQQKGGVSLRGGVGQVGDRYESHADEVASLVVQGRSAETKLDEMSGGGGGASAVQRRPDGNDTRTPITVDAAGVDAMLAKLKGTAAWPKMVKRYADKTTWGYVDLPASEIEDMALDLLIDVERYFRSAVDGHDLTDELLGRSDIQGRLVDGVRAEVFANAPTEVWGMVTEDVQLKDKDGKLATVTKGRVVKLLRAGKGGTFEVEGQVQNQKVTGEIAQTVFKRQPGLTTHDHDNNATTPEVRQEYGYGDFSPDKGKELTSDGADPKVSDVSQGAIGDCYLMAGMGAVVAHRPDLLQKMVAYDGSSGVYTVTFKERQSDGSFKDVPIKVDGHLPTKAGTNPVYAQDGVTKGGNSAALWPAIIEKAYAVWKGDYQEIVGGSPGRAMEAVTGAQSTYPRVPAEDKVIPMFAQWQKDKKAVCVGTVDFIDERKASLFAGSGDGPYRATLPGSGTKAASIVAGSLTLTDLGGKAGAARDDRQGKLTGGKVKEGTVTYKGGQTSVSYTTDAGPAKPEELEAKYRYDRLVSEALNIYANHAYMFERVEGDKLVFANPWGPNAAWQPKPMSAAEFRKYHESISVNAPPKVAER